MTLPSSPIAKSAHRALDVLDLLAQFDHPARASEIADSLGIARSSADQLLKTMVASGYLIFSPFDKRYQPSMRLARFAHWLSAKIPSEDRLIELIGEVHVETGEVVTVTTLNDCYMQIMLAAGSDEGRLATIGKRIPLLGTASGQAALINKSPAQIRSLARRANQRRAVAGAAEPIATLIEAVDQSRRRGHAARTTLRSMFAEEWTSPPEYWASVAVSLPYGDNGELVLSVSGPQERVKPKEWWVADAIRDVMRRQLHA